MHAGEFTQGAAKAVQSIVKTEGVRGLFAGYGSFMLRDLPFDAIEFVAYEQLKKAWTKYKGSDIRPHESAVIGRHLLHLLLLACYTCFVVVIHQDSKDYLAELLSHLYKGQ